jgi:hypothetical protein
MEVDRCKGKAVAVLIRIPEKSEWLGISKRAGENEDSK